MLLPAPPPTVRVRQTGGRIVLKALNPRRLQGLSRRRNHRRNSLHRPSAGARRCAEPRRRRFLDALDSAGRHPQPPLRQQTFRPRRRARRSQLHRDPPQQIAPGNHRPSGGKRSAGEQKAGKAPIIIGRKHNTGNIKPERHRPSGGKRSAGNTNRTKPVKRPEPVQTAGLKSRKNSRSKQPIKNVSTRQSPPAPPRHTPGYEKSPGISGAFHIQSYCHFKTISSTRSTIMAGVTACRQR